MTNEEIIKAANEIVEKYKQIRGFHVFAIQCAITEVEAIIGEIEWMIKRNEIPLYNKYNTFKQILKHLKEM